MSSINNIIRSRARLVKGLHINKKEEGEGGCGVIGAACSAPLSGEHFLESLLQMKNRGNGKGGGIAILGLSSKQLGVSSDVLEKDYIIQIAFLDPSCFKDVKNEFIKPYFEVHAEDWVDTIDNYQDIGLEVKPPHIYRYFCRVKEEILTDFMKTYQLQLSPNEAEDEFVYQNTYALNRKYYSSLGEKRAFVLSHGKNMLVFKIVGYGHQVIKYYKLETFTAHVWIGHHRYPTKGTVWHPGGAHPFIGLNEALVHNGDFSNYHSLSEYLAQRNIFPLFLTDTEVAVYLFDLWGRVYKYPTEYLLEAMAPTTERDFLMLNKTKREIYREIQVAHIHGSPDGPWFFIVGRSKPTDRSIELIGITDTSMLRPQVFALQEGEEKLGLIASERQAIDAFLRSLANKDSRFAGKADIYWNARGGSYTDGGAFIFTVDFSKEKPMMKCTDKFGRVIHVEKIELVKESFQQISRRILNATNPTVVYTNPEVNSFSQLCKFLLKQAQNSDKSRRNAVNVLTAILDSLHLTPFTRDGGSRAIIEESLWRIFREFPLIFESVGTTWVQIDWRTKNRLRAPVSNEKALVMDVSQFPSEGDSSAARFIVDAYKQGWKHIYSFDWRGQRFCGCGLGSNSTDLRIDVYGNPGDYLGSGLDGAEIYVHTSAQDQIAQIMKSGKLVVYGDVGQTFMYGAKGGEAYVLGNAAGRPLINAVGKPRVIINGTCLDYLAESFMAGDPLRGGGFIILNGLEVNQKGELKSLITPYSGCNLFSLASGGAIYIRDPLKKVKINQLNGGQFSSLQFEDWNLIKPYVQENERLFGIQLEHITEHHETHTDDLLKYYRKIEPIKLKVLT
jgi:glutamate synthase domain-containing protein 1/glutamate synthase domain-containing protein 3